MERDNGLRSYVDGLTYFWLLFFWGKESDIFFSLIGIKEDPENPLQILKKFKNFVK